MIIAASATNPEHSAGMLGRFSCAAHPVAAGIRAPAQFREMQPSSRAGANEQLGATGGWSKSESVVMVLATAGGGCDVATGGRHSVHLGGRWRPEAEPGL